MIRTAAALLLLVLVPACKSGNNQDKQLAVRNDYVDALCRIYQGDPQCVQNVQDNCGGVLTFDSGSTCQQFLDFLLFNCSGYLDALYQNKDLVESCVSQLQSFDCSTQTWCDNSGTEFASTGDCLQVDQILQAACAQDTGDTATQ